MGKSTNPFFSRRAFLTTAAGSAAYSTAGAAAPDAIRGRRERAYRIRVDAAALERDQPPSAQTSNGDESLYPARIGSYSKGLPHNGLGEVDPNAFQMFVDSLSSGQVSDMEAIPMGASSSARVNKLTDPLSGLAFDMEGADSHRLSIPAAPAFSSAEQAGEIVENYWLALCRDVAFTDYNTNPLTQAAAAELSLLSDFRGPKINGKVTTQTLFRGFTSGDVVGPWVSQFLLKPVPFGAQYVEQQSRTMAPGIDYLTAYADWLSVQNGDLPAAAIQFDPMRRYMRNGRDMGQWVHVDVLFQAYLNAALILMGDPDQIDTGVGGIAAPLNPGWPYTGSRTMVGFGTFGNPFIAAQVGEAAIRALKAVWYQKWYVHRRVRPEAFAGSVHNKVANSQLDYPIHSDALNSAALQRVFAKNGTYLLPMAFPEGCPTHPSYGAGHATVAGACVTMLKAMYDESFAISKPVVPAADGQSLVPYTGADADKLTVGGELNKLAANIAIGRNFAGVHYRSDYAQSLKLGEAVAIAILEDQRLTYAEEFDGFTFTRFDGTKVTV